MDRSDYNTNQAQMKSVDTRLHHGRIVCVTKVLAAFLAHQYKGTGRAIAVTMALVSELALQNVSFWLKFLKACISWILGWI